MQNERVQVYSEQNKSLATYSYRLLYTYVYVWIYYPLNYEVTVDMT